MISTLLNIVLGIVLVYLSLSVLYLFILSVAGKFFYKKKFPLSTPQKTIAVFVPAYKEDGVIISTAESMLVLDYPKELYDVYILADSFQPQTLSALKQLPINVLEVAFEKSTKTKALNEGFSRINKQYDIALICDADNVLAKNFLKKVNNAFVAGAKAVQGQRIAKNLDSSYAILDACSESINNHIFRRGTNAVGLASAVIGSGMAFDYNLAKNILKEINAIGGFDKPLQIKIVDQGIRIEYLEDALIFDEKVDSLGAFKQQRKRWFSSQFIYMKEYFVPGIKKLFRGNFSYFNLAIANNIVLPRAYFLFLFALLIPLTYFFAEHWAGYYLIAGLVYVAALLIAVPPMLINKQLLGAILKMPEAIWGMILTTLKIKNANKTFIHTVHTKTEVSNPLYDKVVD